MTSHERDQWTVLGVLLQVLTVLLLLGLWLTR